MPVEPTISGEDAWPRMSLAQARAVLTAPGARYEMDIVEIGGVRTRVWKNAPPSLRALVEGTKGFSERTFAVYQNERVSYAEFHRASAHLAHKIQALGIRKGDRVALAMRNLPEWPVIFFAAVSIGAIVVPLNAWWASAEIEYALADSAAKILFIDEERHDRVHDRYDLLPALEQVIISRSTREIVKPFIDLEHLVGAPPQWASLEQCQLPEVDLSPDDDATIFYTSGTSGTPKGALGTHRNIVTSIHSGGYAGDRARLRSGEPLSDTIAQKTGLLVVPLFHVTGCCSGLVPFIAIGGTIVMMRRWDPVEAMELIQRERVQLAGGVPTIAWQLLEHPERDKYDLSSLESVGYGGAPSASELVGRVFEELRASPGNGWGMTETTAATTSHGGQDYLHRPTSAGPPVAVADLKIMDLTGAAELPVGEVGELWARGPMVVKGYWNKPVETAATFIDGWVRTGDLARLDEEGFLYIVDRAKDIVIRGGENIYSSEVEDALYAHPAVIDAAVIGIPHKTLGEEPVAVVHLAAGASAGEAELQAWVRERLASFKVPVAIRFVPQLLPRNANGKILKGELKNLFTSAQ